MQQPTAASERRDWNTELHEAFKHAPDIFSGCKAHYRMASEILLVQIKQPETAEDEGVEQICDVPQEFAFQLAGDQFCTGWRLGWKNRRLD